MKAVKALPDTASTAYATELTNLKTAIANALKPWDKYKKPAAGTTGAPCGFPGTADAPGTRPTCPAPTPAEGATAVPACCAAVVPWKVEAERKFELTTTGRTEVCIIGDVNGWKPT